MNTSRLLYLPLALLLIYFTGCLEEDATVEIAKAPKAVVALSIQPTQSLRYEAVSLEFNTMMRVDWTGQDYVWDDLYADQGEYGSNNRYFNHTFKFGTEVESLSMRGVAGPISGIAPTFGMVTLRDLQSGDLLVVPTCVPNYISLTQSLFVKERGTNRLILHFNPDNIHSDDSGELFLDFAESVGEPGAQ